MQKGRGGTVAAETKTDSTGQDRKKTLFKLVDTSSSERERGKQWEPRRKDRQTDRTGQDRTGQHSTAQNKTGQDRTGRWTSRQTGRKNEAKKQPRYRRAHAEKRRANKFTAPVPNACYNNMDRFFTTLLLP